MKSLKIYEPAMCCSSGVCGPSPDSRLMKLSEDIAFLQSRGVLVERFNLGHQAKAFTDNSLVLEEMGTEAENLPLFLVEGEVKAKGRYPNREELAQWLGIALDEKSKGAALKVVQKDGCCCC